MEHGFVDKYSDLESPIHRLDPRGKIIICLGFVISVVSTPPSFYARFLGYFVLVAAIIFISHVPWDHVFRRSLNIIPFTLAVALFIPFLQHDRFLAFWNVAAKSWLSALCVAMLISTTRFPDMLKGFEKLGMPRIMVMVLSFMYRYVFVFTDEMMRMRRARDARSFGSNTGSHAGIQLRTAGAMIASLFIRAYERGEWVYLAMKSRGFGGEVRLFDNLSFKGRDIGFVIFAGSLLVAIRFGRVWQWW